MINKNLSSVLRYQVYWYILENIFPNAKDNFNITDKNHEESIVLLNPESVINPLPTIPYSDGENHIDQYETKLQS